MTIQRVKNIITREDLRPELVKEMQEKEASGTLNAETDIVPYFFYLATKGQSLNLQPAGTQTPSMIFESAYRSSEKDPSIRQAIEGRNLAYAQKCAYQLIREGFIPYASHIKYIGPLNDANSHHRCVGITMGKLEEINVPAVSIFPECGISSGMIYGCHLHLYFNKMPIMQGLGEKYKTDIGLADDCLPLSFEKGLAIAKREIWSKKTEIIQAIDEKIGVRTI